MAKGEEQSAKKRKPREPNAKRAYRAAIREVWVPITGAKKFSSFEYALVDKWFEDGKPIAWVLEAIRNCEARARKTGYTLFSIGVIRKDLFAVAKQKASLYVGGRVPGSKPRTTNEAEDWRTDWETILLEAWTDAKTQGLKAQYSELIDALPGLTREQVAARAAEIAKGLKWD